MPDFETDEHYIKVRVEFLRIRPEPAGERHIIEVDVLHISRAESVARERAGLRADEWQVLAIVELKPPV